MNPRALGIGNRRADRHESFEINEIEIGRHKPNRGPNIMELLMVGLICLAVLGLLGVLIVLILVRRSGSRPGLSDIEKDYDEQPRRGER